MAILVGATIVKSLNDSPLQTQFHSVPPWVVAFGLSMGLAVVSDKFRHRCAFVIFSCLVAIAGFIMLLANKTNTRCAMAAFSSLPQVSTRLCDYLCAGPI